MLRLFVKKSFFDGWDHLLGLGLVNLGSVAVAALSLLAGLAWLPLPLRALVYLLAALGLGWWYALASFITLRWSDFGDFAASELPAALRATLVPGLQAALLLGADLVAVGVGLPFYLQRGLAGAAAAGLIFWGSLIFLLSLQYYLPLRLRLGGGFTKNLRKSFLLFLDNPGFSLFLFFGNLLALALSLFLAFLAPGVAGVALAQNVALRLRLRKYDWMEEGTAEGGGRRRGTVPWKELLAEDEESVGKRTLKGLIFPWKE